MRFLRFILNCMLFVVVAFTISFAQVGVYGLISAQSKDIEAIHISASNKDEVGYFDQYAFWGTDLAEGCKQPAKHRIRNWFQWDWWKTGTEWADIALDRTIAVIKPLIVPVAQINAVAEYHGYNGDVIMADKILDGEGNIKEEILDAYANDKVAYIQLYEYFTEYRPDLCDDRIWAAVYAGVEANYGGDGTEVLSENTKDLILVIDEDFDFERAPKDIDSKNYDRWVKHNSVVYNHGWKLDKYGSDAYDVYARKFLNEDSTIKTPAVILYSIFYVSTILALIFVIMYPVSLIQAKITGKKRSSKSVDTIA